jgi:hypothetical protein
MITKSLFKRAAETELNLVRTNLNFLLEILSHNGEHTNKVIAVAFALEYVRDRDPLN